MTDGPSTICHQPSATSHVERQFVAVAAAALKVKLMSFVSFGPSVTLGAKESKDITFAFKAAGPTATN